MSFRSLETLEFLEITLADRPILAPILQAASYPLCEYTFTTLYCWRGLSEVQWAFCDGWLFLRYMHEGRVKFLCPVGTGDPRPPMEACFEYLARNGAPIEVTMVPEPIKERCVATGWKFEPDRQNFDYIYLREHLATFAGRHLARKRNQVSRFVERYEWSVTTIRPNDTRECLEFLDYWSDDNGKSGNRLLDFELLALRTCLQALGALDLHAIALRIGGRIIGLEIGEELLSDVFVVHYEKANRAIVGAYAMLIREFARSVPERYTFINREQDLGVPGLRKAKEQLFPIGFSRAYTCRLA